MRIENLKKYYGDKKIYDGFDLELNEEITAVMGRSGCGKTTLLNIIAGTVRPDGGRVTGQGRVAYVFQQPRLVPHLTALGNLMYAGIKPADAKKFLALCGVEEGVYPFRMSGGMAQRTGLARAFAAGADTVLLDEPFKSLDPGLKKRLLDLTASLYRTGAAVLVTHDADEAEYLAARALVLDGGGIVYDARKTDGRFPGLKELLYSL